MLRVQRYDLFHLAPSDLEEVTERNSVGPVERVDSVALVINLGKVIPDEEDPELHEGYADCSDAGTNLDMDALLLLEVLRLCD